MHARWSRSARALMVGAFLFTMLLLALGTGLKTAGAQAATQVCGATDSINNLGPYWINNNLWGASSGSGSQCSWNNSINGSTLSWETSWNWSGSPNSVKSYASAVLGWHWGYKQSGTGLPVQLSSKPPITSSWSFSVSGSSSQDISYDMWVDPNANLGSTQASNEIMIWLYKNGSIQPVGSPVGDVSLDGTTWTLWYGNIGWNVYSFVRDSNTTSATLNLDDFFQNLTTSHGLNSADYILGIESGTEIFTGSGELDTQSYSTVVGGSSGNPTPTLTPVQPTPTPTHGTTPTPVPTTPGQGGACHITYTVQSQWPGGFTGNITMNNTGSATINGWVLVFSFSTGQQIQNAWNTSATQQGSRVTASSLSYNASIAPGSSTSFGFNASWNGSNPAPASFTLNGTVCD
jgi:hypothetical protein